VTQRLIITPQPKVLQLGTIAYLNTSFYLDRYLASLAWSTKSRWRSFPQRPQSTKYKACSCSATKQIRLQREPTHLVIKITRACRELRIFFSFLMFDRNICFIIQVPIWFLTGYLLLLLVIVFLASFLPFRFETHFFFCTRLNFLFFCWCD